MSFANNKTIQGETLLQMTVKENFILGNGGHYEICNHWRNCCRTAFNCNKRIC